MAFCATSQKGFLQNILYETTQWIKNKSEDAEYEEIPGKRKSTATDDDREPASSRPHYTDAHYEDVK